MAIELELRARTRENRKRIRPQNSSDRRTDPTIRYVDPIIYQHGAKNVIKLFIPISICVLIVVFTLNIMSPIPFKDSIYSTPFGEENADLGVIIWRSLVNALSAVAITILSTSIFVVLYVYKFYKVIIGWFLITALLILFGLTFVFFKEILRGYNVSVDYFSAIMFQWNFGITGMICIFWKGPRKFQQAYLVFISARAALMFIRFLPEWTTWTLLVCISIWDVIAVLMPGGPLKKLIDTATEREEPLFPMLIYSTIVYGTMATSDGNVSEGESAGSSTIPSIGYSSESNQQSNVKQSADTQSPHPPRPRKLRRRRRRKKKFSEKDEAGFRLGLGDFVFYSVLVGKASLFGNWFTMLACFLAVVIGLCFTLFLLVWFKKALPALPLSIVIGMLFYFFFRHFVEPFETSLSPKLIFI